jgi:hypothetical protein
VKQRSIRAHIRSVVVANEQVYEGLKRIDALTSFVGWNGFYEVEDMRPG